MKRSDGIEQYVEGKHASGVAFEEGESNLTALFRQVGDVDLSQVKTQQVVTYLDGSETGAITWRLKYQILFRFFDFWFSRGGMPELLMPAARGEGAPDLRSVCLYANAASSPVDGDGPQPEFASKRGPTNFPYFHPCSLCDRCSRGRDAQPQAFGCKPGSRDDDDRKQELQSIS
ncbi:MAG: site-specific recombinase XerD [Edaphobacter sp.]|nr:site-specific recombinase XerD [Edaphobacter sp.]